MFLTAYLELVILRLQLVTKFFIYKKNNENKRLLIWLAWFYFYRLRMVLVYLSKFLINQALEVLQNPTSSLLNLISFGPLITLR